MRRLALGILALLVVSTSALADQVAIGQLFFTVPNAAEFDINNFTGAGALPPDFPVITGLTLTGTLTLTSTGGQCAPNCILSGIVLGPGDQFSGSTYVQDSFDPNLLFTSATFAGTLTPIDVMINGNLVSLLSSFSVTLSPQNGTAIADQETAVIYANTTPTSVVPEPGSLLLLASGLAGLAARKYWRAAH